MGGRGSMSSTGASTLPWPGFGTGTADQRIQAASKYLEDNSGYKAGRGVKYIDPDLFEANVQALVALEQRYHVGDPSDVRKRAIETTRHGNHVAACYSQSTQDIELNTKYYGDKKKLENVEANSSAPRSYYGGMAWHYINQGSSPKVLQTYSITHEYGHAFQGNMWKKALIKGDTSQSFAQYAASCKREIMAIARKKYGNGAGTNFGVSGYGRKNSKEFFAEAFAGYNTGYVNPVTQAMGDWLAKKGY